jgi:cobalt-zinc-cadmium efflux system protein
VGHDHAAELVEARRAGNKSRMWVALAINVALMAATAVGGFLTGSLALLADAGHLLSDVGAIAVGLVAARLAGIAPTPERSFGFKRTEILGALANGLLLVVIAVLIAVQAVARFSDSHHVAGGGVLALGAVGLVGNAAATWVLAAGSRADINLEAVLRHSAGDALSSFGVVVAGVVVLATGWDQIDPVVSLLIAALILVGSGHLLKEPFDILMESTPAGVDARRVGSEMAADPDVVEVHDLHIWTVTSGFPALSAHVVVKPGTNRDIVRARLELLARDRFDLHHTTLQVVESAGGDLIAVENLQSHPVNCE